MFAAKFRKYFSSLNHFPFCTLLPKIDSYSFCWMAGQDIGLNVTVENIYNNFKGIAFYGF